MKALVSRPRFLLRIPRIIFNHREHIYFVNYIIGLLFVVFEALPGTTYKYSNLKCGEPLFVVQGIGLFEKFCETKTEVTISSSLEELRAETGVRQLEEMENALAVSELPNGVFGFEVPWQIGREKNFDFTLSRDFGGTAVVEIHKSFRTGEVYVVGYIEENMVKRLQNVERRSKIRVTVYFVSGDDRRPVAIPAHGILESNNRRIEGDNGTSYYIADMVIY